MITQTPAPTTAYRCDHVPFHETTMPSGAGAIQVANALKARGCNYKFEELVDQILGEPEPEPPKRRGK